MTVRLLVTGFTPFPGAPVNPTELLIRHFQVNPPLEGDDVAFRFAVLPVDYAGAVPAIEAVASEFDPHVVIHFGLAGEATGFRLETLARNEISARIPDNSGLQPVRSVIRDGLDHVPSTLPLDAIADALAAAAIPVQWSDDAGGYLCNFVFFNSASGLCRGVSAAIGGFVHVGPVEHPGEESSATAIPFRKLVEGAEIVMKTSVDAFLNP